LHGAGLCVYRCAGLQAASWDGPVLGCSAVVSCRHARAALRAYLHAGSQAETAVAVASCCCCVGLSVALRDCLVLRGMLAGGPAWPSSEEEEEEEGEETGEGAASDASDGDPSSLSEAAAAASGAGGLLHQQQQPGAAPDTDSIEQSVQQLSLGSSSSSRRQQQQQEERHMGSINKAGIGKGSGSSRGHPGRERKADRGPSNAYMDESLLPPSQSESEEDE
jgi:hypothetical protein